MFEKHNFKFEKCQNCKLVRINPQPTVEELAKLYNTSYFDSWGKEEDYIGIKKSNFEYILKTMPNLIRPQKGSLVLDVGAATGIFMSVLQHHGYRPYGVELAQDGVQAICAKFSPESVYSGFFEDIDFSDLMMKEDQKFSFVFMSDFLEHVRNPNLVLSKAYQILQPGGGVTIHVPNSGSLFCLILGKKWELYSQEHLFYFNKKICGSYWKTTDL